MNDEAENELREIRAKMERGELDPRQRPEPTPDNRGKDLVAKWQAIWDEIMLRHLGDDPGLPLGWEGIEPVDGDDLDHTHTSEAWWADRLIRESGCTPP